MSYLPIVSFCRVRTSSYDPNGPCRGIRLLVLIRFSLVRVGDSGGPSTPFLLELSQLYSSVVIRESRMDQITFNISTLSADSLDEPHRGHQPKNLHPNLEIIKYLLSLSSHATYVSSFWDVGPSSRGIGDLRTRRLGKPMVSRDVGLIKNPEILVHVQELTSRWVSHGL